MNTIIDIYNKTLSYNKNDDKSYDEESNKYTDIIKSFTKLNNNVYLSAIIDETNNFTYYKKDIRHMIDLGYLCDYNICEYLISNYKNIIIYCNSLKERIKINKMINEIH